MKYLVTGGTGFLGRHLLEALTKEDPSTEIILLVRSKVSWSNLDWASSVPQVKLVEGNLEERDRWAGNELLDGLSGIFHLAALVKHSRSDRDLVFKVNVTGTTSMVRLAAEKACRLVFVSTSGTVGCFETAHEIADESASYADNQVGFWPYYASKIEAERQARALSKKLNSSLVILRPPMMLGPGDHRHRSTAQMIRFMKGRVPVLIEGGIHYVDIRDSASACVRAMKHPNPKEIYHLPGTACTVQEFFKDVGEFSGKTPPRIYLPFKLARKLAEWDHRIGIGLFPDPVVVEMAAHYWGLRSLYAQQDLGFHPRSGRETLKDTVQWLTANVDGLK